MSDLKTLLRTTAPVPGTGPDVDAIGRRAGRRRAVRLGSIGATGLAVATAATLVVLNGPADLPVPDVVNPPSGTGAPTQGPTTSGPGGTSGWVPPRLEVIGLRDDRQLVRHGPDGGVAVLATNPDAERHMTAIDVAVVDGGTIRGAYVSTIGESDDLWWFQLALDGDETLLAPLADTHQPRQAGGASEIGWPAPAVSPTNVLAHLEAQGSDPAFGGEGYVSTIRLVTFGADGFPDDASTDFTLPRSSAPLVAADLGRCPGQDELLCLLTLDDGNLREFHITTDGTLTLENAPTQFDIDDVRAANVLAAASTTSFDGATARWALQQDVDGFRVTNIDDPRVSHVVSGDPEREPVPWFDVFEDTAALVTASDVWIVDLPSGRMARGPDSLSGINDGVIVATHPPLPDANGQQAAAFLTALADGTISTVTASEPLADEIALALGSAIHATVRGEDRFRRAAWTIELGQDQFFEARVGPFNALDTLAAADEVTAVTVDPQTHCASAQVRAPPPGFAEHERVRIEGTSSVEASSCLAWFAVDLFLDADGRIAAVALQLWEP